MKLWKRAVDQNVFMPMLESNENLIIYTGRVSKEKNLEAFFELDLEFPKFVVGEVRNLKNIKNILLLIFWLQIWKRVS